MGQVLSPKLEQILREQQITETEPGTILHDFEAFLEFIATNQIITSGKNHLLPLACLALLNARMAQPIESRLKRPHQKSYPHLHGLYLLARATGLMRVQKHRKDAVLVVDSAAIESWIGLNHTERYFALLEAWFNRASLEMVGERSGWGERMQSKCLMIWQHIPEKGLKIDKSLEQSVPYWGLHNLALLEMFGLLRIMHGKPQQDKGWVIDRIERTGFGGALLSLIAESRSIEERLADLFREDDEEASGEVIFNAYQELLQPYFPEWQHNLTLPSEDEFRDGVFIFKVSLGKPWRRIAIPAALTLSDLASEILDAFDFDHDHLHCFEYKDRFGLMARVNHPYMDESPFTDEVKVGEVPLQPGEAMRYVFDFGDNWQFKVELESIDPPNRAMNHPEVIESHGKAPQQYRDWSSD